MRVGVVFAGAIVLICFGGGIERGQLFEPFFVIFMQSAFVIVDEDAGGYMRCLIATSHFPALGARYPRMSLR
jgi:hypothetical protein